MAASSLTAERLRELLHYDPETSLFTWRNDAGRWGRIKAGSVAGSPNEDGYIRIGIDGGLYRAHRLAFLYMTGAWPTADVDHKFGIRSDNRWSEIRDATHAQNLQNRRSPQANSKSGLLGVSWHNGRPRAQIRVGGIPVHLGYFDTPELAHAAYLEAKARHHEFQTLVDVTQ